MLAKFNESLNGYINLISLVSLLISFAAFIISTIAFKRSSEKAELVFRYAPYDATSKEHYGKDGKGDIVLNGNHVDGDVRSGNEFKFIIENKSNTVALYPKIQFEFINMDVPYSSNEEFESIDFVSDGNYSKMLWIPKDETSIHKGIDIVIEGFEFAGANIYGEKASIKVTLSASNMNTKQFEIPISVR